MNEKFFSVSQFALNKKLLCSIGTWPYTKSSLTLRLHHAFILVMIAPCIVLQAVKVCEEMKSNVEIALEVLPPMSITIITLIKYSIVLINKKTIKKLFDRIRCDYEALMKLPHQRVLMESASMLTRKVTIIYSSLFYSAGLIHLSTSLYPIALDIVNPLNETRKRILIFEAEYFVDPKKHYNQIIIKQFSGTVLAIHMLVSFDTMFMMFSQHACTLLAVTSNHIRYAYELEEKEVKRQKCAYEDKTCTKFACQKIIRKLKLGIQLHMNAISFSELLISTFSTSLGFIILVIILCFSVSGVMILINFNQPNKVMSYLAFTLAQITHLFILCLSGQRLINYSERLHDAIYSTNWYLYPTEVKPLYNLMLLRSFKPCIITAAKISALNMETFLRITQTAISYFTVISSVR